MLADAFQGSAAQKKLFQQTHWEGTRANSGVADFHIFQQLVGVLLQMLLYLMRGHKQSDGLFRCLILDACLQIGNEAFAAHVTDNFLGRVESTFVLVVLQ